MHALSCFNFDSYCSFILKAYLAEKKYKNKNTFIADAEFNVSKGKTKQKNASSPYLYIGIWTLDCILIFKLREEI